MIDAASNTVVATVPVGSLPQGVAVTPDGTHAYVANEFSNTVSVIDTTSNTVVATVTVGNRPLGVAVTPDGKHAYVTNEGSNNVSVIDTATNIVVATVVVAPVGAAAPSAVTVTPDGKHAYVAILGFPNGAVSVIDTASNTVVATVPVGGSPLGVAVTPDGKHAYVAIAGSPNGKVSVIDTASNTVVATVTVGSDPVGVGIIPPPAGVPFSAFSAKLEIDLDKKPNEDRFELQSSFTLGAASNGINPPAEAVTLQIGVFATSIPPGSFKGKGFGPFRFHGVIDGVALEVEIEPTGTKRYALEAYARDANLTGTKNPVTVMLAAGDDSGMTSVKADLD